MSVLELNDKYLYEVTDTFDFNNPPIKPIELANSLIETMREKGGMGLSANQVGYKLSVFALRSIEPLVMFNPKITATDGEEVWLEEGCLSFPDYFIKIKRPSIVRVRYLDYNGNFKVEKYVGMTARIIQHEYDHLQGITFHDRANKIHKDRADRQYRKRMKKQKDN